MEGETGFVGGLCVGGDGNMRDQVGREGQRQRVQEEVTVIRRHLLGDVKISWT